MTLHEIKNRIRKHLSDAKECQSKATMSAIVGDQESNIYYNAMHRQCLSMARTLIKQHKITTNCNKDGYDPYTL